MGGSDTFITLWKYWLMIYMVKLLFLIVLMVVWIIIFWQYLIIQTHCHTLLLWFPTNGWWSSWFALSFASGCCFSFSRLGSGRLHLWVTGFILLFYPFLVWGPLFPPSLLYVLVQTDWLLLMILGWAIILLFHVSHDAYPSIAFALNILLVILLSRFSISTVFRRDRLFLRAYSRSFWATSCKYRLLSWVFRL